MLGLLDVPPTTGDPDFDVVDSIAAAIESEAEGFGDNAWAPSRWESVADPSDIRAHGYSFDWEVRVEIRLGEVLVAFFILDDLIDALQRPIGSGDIVAEAVNRFRQVRGLLEKPTQVELVASAQLLDSLGALLQVDHDELYRLYEEVKVDLDEARERIKMLEAELDKLRSIPLVESPSTRMKLLKTVGICVAALLPVATGIGGAVIGADGARDAARTEYKAAYDTAKVEQQTALATARIDQETELVKLVLDKSGALPDNPADLVVVAHQAAEELELACEG